MNTHGSASGAVQNVDVYEMAENQGPQDFIHQQQSSQAFSHNFSNENFEGRGNNQPFHHRRGIRGPRGVRLFHRRGHFRGSSTQFRQY